MSEVIVKIIWGNIFQELLKALGTVRMVSGT